MKLEIDAVRSAAERVARSHGLDLVDIEFTGAGKTRVLRLFVEKDAAGREALKARAAAEDSGLPSGVPVEALSGVTHEDCATFATDFGTLLDVEDLVPGSAEYTLEVSSPGIERKLVRAADWERFQGFLATAKLFTPINGGEGSDRAHELRRRDCNLRSVRRQTEGQAKEGCGSAPGRKGQRAHLGNREGQSGSRTLSVCPAACSNERRTRTRQLNRRLRNDGIWQAHCIRQLKR